MKASVLPLALVPLFAFASACASTPRPPAMPAWSPDLRAEAQPITAAAPLFDDDETIRVPREDEPEKKLWQAQGLYIGGELIASQPLGDFDGDSALFGPTDVITVPDLDAGGGGGLYVAYRWRMNELMLEYSITEHDGEVSGSPREHDSEFQNWDLNWRHYFWEHSPIQPYGLLGIGMGRVEIDDGSTDQATGTVFQDAVLKDGILVNVGAGLAVYTLPWVMFYGQAMYRFGRYPTSKGIDGELSNTPDIDGDSWSVSAGAAFRLLPPRNHSH